METTRHPEAAVTLNDVNCMASCSGRLAVMAGFQIEAANATQHGARRGLLDRIARSNKQVELAWRDDQSLHLPAIIDYFPECNSIKTSIPDWQPAHIALRIPPEKLPEPKPPRRMLSVRHYWNRAVAINCQRPDARPSPCCPVAAPFSTYTSSTTSQGRWRWWYPWRNKEPGGSAPPTGRTCRKINKAGPGPDHHSYGEHLHLGDFKK